LKVKFSKAFFLHRECLNKSHRSHIAQSHIARQQISDLHFSTNQLRYVATSQFTY